MIILISQLMLITKLTQENPRGTRYMETVSRDQRSCISPVAEWHVWSVHQWNTIHCTMLYFEQGGTPRHCTGKLKNCVKFFPGDALGTEDIEWPPRSPDIMPLDIFLWGDLEHHSHPHTIRDRKEIICAATKDITPQTLECVCCGGHQNFNHKTSKCRVTLIPRTWHDTTVDCYPHNRTYYRLL